MRYVVFCIVALMLAGCGTTASSEPSPSPTPLPQPQLFKYPPHMTINVNHTYTAVMQTNRGTFTIHLLPKVAPVTVNNFVFLARHRFYNGNIFTRIIKNFVIQTGDPTGTGFGGPGYSFKDEKVTMKYTPGVAAMANSGANTNGSQFFIVSGRRGKTLAPKYTIFGKVSSGMGIVEKIASTPVGPNPGTGEYSLPLQTIVLKRVTIRESP